MANAGDRAPTVVLGVIARAHGVRGEVRLKLHNPASTTLGAVRTVTLRPRDGEAREVAVEAVRGTADAPILALAGVHDRDAAEALRGAEVAVPRAALPQAGEGEWYVVDLIGLRVRDAQGTLVGEVEDVVAYPSVDCLRVRSGDGVREVPMMEPWFEDVDFEAREVRVGSLEDVPVQGR
jgi:16S rRNA processing protein RimM